jgi:hypothetical protein
LTAVDFKVIDGAKSAKLARFVAKVEQREAANAAV